jgi:hypothetical protein
MFITSVMKGMTHANPNSSLFTIQIVIGILFEVAMAFIAPTRAQTNQ